MNIKPNSNSRLRFWTWLWVWSVVVAAASVGFMAQSTAFDGSGTDAKTILVGQAIAFITVAIATLIISFLVIFTWRNLPRSRTARFWLVITGVSIGILWNLFLVWTWAAEGQVFSRMYVMCSLLAWSMVFLCLAAFIASLEKIFRWLFSWRNLKRGLLTLVGVAMLIAAFYAEENWRGRRAWENYQREWEAKEEKFDFLSFVPPAVPDGENFAMTPIVVSTYAGRLDKRDDDDSPQATKIVNQLDLELERTNLSFNTNVTIGSWQRTKLTNLKPWQDYYRTMFETNHWLSQPQPYLGGAMPENTDTNVIHTNVVVTLSTSGFPIATQPQSPAADVLLALSRYDAPIEELRQAAKRPYSRFPLNYGIENPAEIPMPQQKSLKHCVAVLQLRAIAEVQAGETDQALADVKLMLRLADSIHTEPRLISYLARLTLVNMAIQPIWEGLAERRWSDGQLKELNLQLVKIDFVSGWKFFLRADRAEGMGYIEYERRHRDISSTWLVLEVCPTAFESLDRLPDLPQVFVEFLDRLGRLLPDDFVSRIVRHLPPDGWYELNKVALAKIYQEHLFQIADPEKHLISQQTAAELNAFLEKARQEKNISPQNVLALMGTPAIPSAAQKTAFGQCSVDLAILGCALERYRLAHGQYPQTLAVLAPEYIQSIPPDVVDGQPLHYRRTDDGRFVLYSAGWNGKDDGGTIGLNEYGRVDFRKGDWVWQYPVK